MALAAGEGCLWIRLVAPSEVRQSTTKVNPGRTKDDAK